MTTSASPIPHSIEDERVRQTSFLTKMLRRPELGAITGTIVVWLVFAFAAGSTFTSVEGSALYFETASELGILAVAVSLLMISGEIDLSIGSMIGAAGMASALFATEYDVALPLSIILSLLFCLGLGFFNGFLVVRTRLPSFIITLGSLFFIRGLAIGIPNAIAGTANISALPQNVPGWTDIRPVFDSALWSTLVTKTRTGLGGRLVEYQATVEFDISIFWWLAIAIIATWILMRTPIGNWIFAIGGDENAARNVGVPVNSVKIGLFMTTAASAWLVAHIQVFGVGSANSRAGELQELYAIAAAVIGGTLLTGGYGSAIGGMLGALIFGMVRQGVPGAGIDSDWDRVILGSLIVIAVLINNVVRNRAMGRE
ncbi:MAG: ABC transporter permease [Chloroflexi bacterium]|nr:ABC transporter permease [Chloroflexota bacterium]